ncbi:hypothetical protein [Roseisolibacter sp. H3M3-2]|uniref:hypothetical protein n=1 Tax=Roseisolibacter sp. H3M3-2 TaxID=3031323 RepID=UPI0023DCB607|nr:hypothetical protein [Roseisolibacter sp. H3M3-2]MDF1505567.1 hypothetical protein [Roseisolibacter sp. H3M3-2]
MRKIVGPALVVAATLVLPACRASAPAAVVTSAGEPVADPRAGAGSASAAVEGFLRAARANDPTAMARLFGTTAGPITEREAADAVEKRMRALACYLTHDASRIVDNLVGVGQGRALTIELTQRELTRRSRFTVVSGPGGRWFVEQFEIDKLSDFCRPATPG